MQIDGMIATVLKQEPKDQRSCVAAWRQLSDILAQRGNQLPHADIRRSFHALTLLRARVPESDRRASAAAVAKRGRFAPLVAFYASDVPAVASTMLRDAALEEQDWLALLPATNAVARSLLRERDDLPDSIHRALASLGAGSVALPGPETAEESSSATQAGPGASQISELVRRIDKYRAGQALDNAPLVRETFMFETGPDGIIHWVDGIARGCVIGLSIAEAAFGGEPGTDGVAAGAFRQRAEMINARMRIEGDSNSQGEWRFSALPWFDSSSGQFRGYRGSARRPQRNELPYGSPITSDAGDSIRQLIHELRSPLNAISGFAQIVAGQMFGPVNQSYRQMADSIVADAGDVQSIIDDLDTTARAGLHNQGAPSNETSDMEAILHRVTQELAPLLAEQQSRFQLTKVGGPYAVMAGENEVRRMTGRLMTALVDIAGPQEDIAGQLIFDQTAPDKLLLRVLRPVAIHNASENELLDPGYSPEGDAPGAAILSLGFSLRLVASLAQSVGGRLEIGHNSLTLRLPSANSLHTAERSADKGD